MAYFALQNLILAGKEYTPGDEIELENPPYIEELMARQLVTDRPPRKKNTRN